MSHLNEKKMSTSSHPISAEIRQRHLCMQNIRCKFSHTHHVRYLVSPDRMHGQRKNIFKWLKGYCGSSTHYLINNYKHLRPSLQHNNYNDIPVY